MLPSVLWGQQGFDFGWMVVPGYSKGLGLLFPSLETAAPQDKACRTKQNGPQLCPTNQAKQDWFGKVLWVPGPDPQKEGCVALLGRELQKAHPHQIARPCPGRGILIPFMGDLGVWTLTIFRGSKTGVEGACPVKHSATRGLAIIRLGRLLRPRAVRS